MAIRAVTGLRAEDFMKELEAELTTSPLVRVSRRRREALLRSPSS